MRRYFTQKHPKDHLLHLHLWKWPQNGQSGLEIVFSHPLAPKPLLGLYLKAKHRLRLPLDAGKLHGQVNRPQ